MHDQHRRWIILAWALFAVPLGIRDSTPGHELVSVYVAWAVISGMVNSWVVHAWIRKRNCSVVEERTAALESLLDNDRKAYLGAENGF